MEAQVSEVLENILGLLALEGSFEVTEGPDEVMVTIEANDPGRLIGYRGETLDSLQMLVNMIANRQRGESEFKRVVVDVEGWRKNKENDLQNQAKSWTEEVIESGKELELEPMPSWQRRIVHMVVSELEGVESESVGDGRDRHLVIRPITVIKKKTSKSKKEVVESPVES